MKRLLIGLAAAAVSFPIAFATPAAAQSWEYRREMRECNRELRRADSEREYRRELRECRRELRRAQRYGSRYGGGSRYYSPYSSRYYRYDYDPYRYGRGYGYDSYRYGYGRGYGYDPYYGDGAYFGFRIR